MKKQFIYFCAIITLAGCGLGKTGGARSPAASTFRKLEILDPVLNSQVLSLFQTKCAACHGPSSAGDGNLNFILDVEKLVFRGLVQPGAVSSSRLYARSADNSMPPGQGLSSAELSLISTWIEKGIGWTVVTGPAGDQTPTPTPLPQLQFPANASARTKQALTILNNRCASCHSSSSGDSAGGGVVNILDPRQMLISGLVFPGDATGSPLYDSIARGRMPKGSALSATDAQTLRDWINLDFTNNPSGLPNFTPVPLAPTFQSIRRNILATRCILCHGGSERTAEGISYTTYTATMRTVVAGDATRGKFYNSMADGEMPDRFHRVTNAELQVVAEWINSGAPNN